MGALHGIRYPSKLHLNTRGRSQLKNLRKLLVDGDANAIT